MYVLLDVKCVGDDIYSNNFEYELKDIESLKTKIVNKEELEKLRESNEIVNYRGK